MPQRGRDPISPSSPLTDEQVLLGIHRRGSPASLASWTDNMVGEDASLSTLPPSAIKDFVQKCGGHTIITKVLIANNGMAAVKAIRSIRKWSYEMFGDERVIQFTAMCTPEDLRVNAEFIRMADQFVEVPGGTANNNYANVDLIVDIAERTGVHAVWVGWGFASENPVLSEKLNALANKVVFIGPSAGAMRGLGDKIASTIVAQSAEVPCVEWSGSGLVTSSHDPSGHIIVPDEIYQQATTHDAEEGLKHAKRIGFPVMIKASEGGGGKGIRLVRQEQDFGHSFTQVQREVPGSPVFIMRLVENSRHLEVQLLADQYDNAIALFGRDCTTQRRHQKIFEEAPIVIASQDILDEMEKAAVRLAKMVGYVSAGTVEYLFDPSTKKYFFLELNPRLQVEHPTTEMVSGVNIPAAQLQVAMGIPLHCIRDIRVLYGVNPNGSSQIDFDFSNPQWSRMQKKPQPRGHVIAARITAENPDAGFKPNSGKVVELNFRSNSNVWGYFSVNASGGVHEYADSQFGHVFSYGLTRPDARKNLIMALKELSIRGDFRTTVEYLTKLLETPTFMDNEVTTGWLDSLIAKKVEVEKPDHVQAAICGASFLACTRFDATLQEYTKALEKGQTPSKSLLSTSCQVEFIYDNVQFSMTVLRTGPESIILVMNKSRADVRCKLLADHGLLVSVDGKSHLVYGKQEANGTQLTMDGRSILLEKENDPTKLRSPSPGKLVRYLIDDGAHVASGAAFAEIEVMKMYMPLLATESGVIHFTKPAGTVLTNGDIIANLVLDDPSHVRKATVFEGKFPVYGPPVVTGDKPHQRYRDLHAQLVAVLDGYEPARDAATMVRHLFELLRNPEVPYYEMSEVMASLSGRIPAKLDASLRKEMDSKKEQSMPFPAVALQAIMDTTRASLSLDELTVLNSTVSPIQEIITRYSKGMKYHERTVIAMFLERFHAVEEAVDGKRFEDVLLQLRDKNKNDVTQAVRLALALSKPVSRSDFILALLDHIRVSNDTEQGKEAFVGVLKHLTELSNKSTSSKVAIKARELLMTYQMPTYEERYATYHDVLRASVKPDDGGFDYFALSKLITANFAILDVLPSFFYHEHVGIQAAAFYTYVLHTYQAYTVTSVKHVVDHNHAVLCWDFTLRLLTGPNVAKSVAKPLALHSTTEPNIQRKGVMVAFNSLEEMTHDLERVVTTYGEPSADIARLPGRKAMVNVINVAIKDADGKLFAMNDDAMQQVLGPLCRGMTQVLRQKFIKRLTFMVVKLGQFPRYFTFKESHNFEEDEVIRHIDPAMTYQLELQRLSNFQLKPVFKDNRRIHAYHAVGKKNPSDVRFFVRAIVYPGQIVHAQANAHEFLSSEGHRILTDIIDELEVVSSQYPNTDCNHLYISFVPTFELDLDAIEQTLQEFVSHHGQRLFKLRITNAEVRFIMQTASGSAKPVRFFISGVTGYMTRIEMYQEVRDAMGTQKLMSLSSPPGSLHMQPISSPYSTKEAIQPKRYKAHLMGTTYVYDFPDLFQRGLEKIWLKYQQETGARPPTTMLNVTELILSQEDPFGKQMDGNCSIQPIADRITLLPSSRPPGVNTTGMVAWEMEMFTPEYLEGRKIVVIANDITFNIGSFGPLEDLVFYKASQYARERGIPRIYISANSGARIGLAEEVSQQFKAAWVDEANPSKGFEYLYLDQDGFDQLVADRSEPIVHVERLNITPPRYRILDIVGKQHGLGVENLQGSGMIAGETSLAYDEIFTLTLVTCRSVGIGAYLVRLGQRAIQVEYTPIILTGAAALNKVLGREVYTSNLQLGGTQIMYKNGVSHLVALNDMEGVKEVLNWLAYVPKHHNAPLPVLPSTDDADRDIDVEIPQAAYDPRTLLCGQMEQDYWMSGFFDKDSFTETLSGWAKGVVVGRARLGGIPMGVIAVECRTTEQIVWADPAIESSTEQTQLEAGQVWYPNSAFKTAQAIRDFNNGEQLPLMIFANWRGFSGGQGDMYKEILKFGSYIVDALRSYKQPVFVYLIGELRGGAWVVLDPTINPDMMEMYAEANARGGVLEPEGIVEIKFRKPQLLAAMSRLDPMYADLKKRLSDASLPADQKMALQQQFEKREKDMLPIMHQAAIQFADLHDRPGRMLSKQVVSRVVPWRAARKFFYWRLLRRTSEESAIKSLCGADPSVTRQQARYVLSDLYSSLVLPTQQHARHPSESADYDHADVAVVRFLTQQQDAVESRRQALRTEYARKQIAALIKECPQAVQGISDALAGPGLEERERWRVKQALAALKMGLE